MNTYLIKEILLIIAVLSTGITYGADIFFAIIVRTAVKSTMDSSIADLVGHIHLIADKRMPLVGITSIISSILFICLTGFANISGWLALMATLSLLGHLIIYLTFAKPINSKMSAAVKEGALLPNIRKLQQKWDSVISIRAVILTITMIMLLTTIISLR